MAEININRKTEISSLLTKKQVDDIKTHIGEIVASSSKNITRAGLLIAEIFKDFKDGQFTNKYNRQVLRSYKLLQNLSKEDGDFISFLTDQVDKLGSNLEEKISEVVSSVDVQEINLDNEKPNDNNKLHNIVIDIVKEYLEIYKKNENIESKSVQSESHVYIDKLKLHEQSIIGLYNSQIFNSILNFQKLVHNSLINGKIDKHIVKIQKKFKIRDTFFSRIKRVWNNTSKTQMEFTSNKNKSTGIFTGVLKNMPSLKKNVINIVDDAYSKICNKIKSIRKSSSFLKFFSFVGFIVGGVAKLVGFVVGVAAKIGKLAFGIVKGVTKFVGGIIGNILNSNFFKGLFEFLKTPAGAYMLGVLYGAATDFLKKTVKKIGLGGVVDKIKKFFVGMENNIKDFFKDNKLAQIIEKIENWGKNIDIISLIDKAIKTFSVENLAIGALSFAAGKASRWAIDKIFKKIGFKGILKGIMRGAKHLPLVSALVTPWIALFSDMEASKKSHQAHMSNRMGLHYANRLQRFNKKPKKEHNEYTGENIRIIQERLKTATQTQGVSFIQEAIEKTIDDQQHRKDYQKVLDFLKQESDRIQKEKIKLENDIASGDDTKLRELAFPIKYEFNGKVYTTNMLPQSMPFPVIFRARNIVQRTKLLSMLDYGAKTGQGELKTQEDYLNIVDNDKDANLKIYQRDGKYTWKTDYKAAGDIQFYTGDHRNDYYKLSTPKEVKEREIDWSDQQKVIEALNFSIGKITDDQERKEQDFAEGNIEEYDMEIDEKITNRRGINTIGIEAFSKYHVDELIQIIVDMCCDRPTIMPGNGYIKKNSVGMNIMALLSSRKFKNAFDLTVNVNGKDYKIEFDKTGDVTTNIESYSHDKSKFIDFIYNIPTRSRGFLDAFYGIFTEEISDCYNGGYTFVSFPSGAVSEDDYVVLYNIYRGGSSQYSYNIIGYRYENIKKDEYKFPIKETPASGNRYCFVAKQHRGTIKQLYEEFKRHKMLKEMGQYIGAYPIVKPWNSGHKTMCSNVLKQFGDLIQELIQFYFDINGEMKNIPQQHIEESLSQKVREFQQKLGGSSITDNMRSIGQAVQDNVNISEEQFMSDQAQIQSDLGEIKENIREFSEGQKQSMERLEHVVGIAKEARGIQTSKNGDSEENSQNVSQINMDDNHSVNDVIARKRAQSHSS